MNTEKTDQANVFVESAKKASSQEENKNPLGQLVSKGPSTFFGSQLPSSTGGGLFEIKSADSSSAGRGNPVNSNPFLNNAKQGVGLTSMVSTQKGLFSQMAPQPNQNVQSLFSAMNQNPAQQPAPSGGLFNQLGQSATISQPANQNSFFNTLGSGTQSGLFQQNPTS